MLPTHAFCRLQNFLGITGHPLPHSHDCGHAGAVQLGENNQHHIQIFPIYGRALKAHDEVKFLMVKMVRQFGVANVARTEVRLPGPAGNYDCDIVYFDRKTHKRVVLEITRVAITQASISGSRGPCACVVSQVILYSSAGEVWRVTIRREIEVWVYP